MGFWGPRVWHQSHGCYEEGSEYRFAGSSDDPRNKAREISQAKQQLRGIMKEHPFGGGIKECKCMAGWWFQIFFIFTPNPGEMIHFDEHIFEMGWFNHQLDGNFAGIPLQ